MGSGVSKPGLIVLLAFLAPQTLHAACAPGTLEVRTTGGVARFGVEIADEPAEQAQGLMYREKMAASAGMLFVFPNPRRTSFWMKNTFLPLDMIFADSAGRVTRVHEGAVPGDLTGIDSGPDVRFVLEINAGLSARMGIAPGAVLRHPSVDAAGQAVWPCTP